jgi:hypothetical protein
MKKTLRSRQPCPEPGIVLWGIVFSQCFCFSFFGWNSGCSFHLGSLITFKFTIFPFETIVKFYLKEQFKKYSSRWAKRESQNIDLWYPPGSEKMMPKMLCKCI